MQENILFLQKESNYCQISAIMRFTSIVLPKAFNVDDMRLEIWFCRLHIHVVSHMVHAVLEAAVLTVSAFQVGLP